MLGRPIKEIALFAENNINNMIPFPAEETNRTHVVTITSGESYVEVLKKRFLVKIKLWNGATVYMTYYKFLTCRLTCLITQQLNWSHTQLACALIGHVNSVYVTNVKIALLTVIVNYLSKVNYN